MTAKKILLTSLLILSIVISILPVTAFAETVEACPVIATDRRELTYNSEGTIKYSVTVPDKDSTVSVLWTEKEPNGITWEMVNNNASVVFQSSSDTYAVCGSYPFVLTSGENCSNEAILVITPKTVNIPSEATSFEYNSELQKAVLPNPDICLSGTCEATAAGEYVAKISLKDQTNYRWSDGTTETRTVRWTISKKSVTVSGIKVKEKECDGSTSAVFDTSEVIYSGMVEGDTLSCDVKGNFKDSRVGSGKSIDLEVSLSGKDAGNYILTEESQNKAFGAVIRSDKEGSVECVTNPSNNYRNGNVTQTDDQFIEIITDKSLKSMIRNGANLKVWLSISDISDSVSDSDVKKIDSAKGNATVAAYLDVNIFRQFETEEEPVKIPEIDEQITIEMNLPKNMINKDKSMIRSYELIRVHNGEAIPVQAEYDAENNILSFSTDQFSTYALTFTDTDNPEDISVKMAIDGNYTVIWVISVILIGWRILCVLLKNGTLKKALSNGYVGKH